MNAFYRLTQSTQQKTQNAFATQTHSFTRSFSHSFWHKNEFNSEKRDDESVHRTDWTHCQSASQSADWLIRWFDCVQPSHALANEWSSDIIKLLFIIKFISFFIHSFHSTCSFVHVTTIAVANDVEDFLLSDSITSVVPFALNQRLWFCHCIDAFPIDMRHHRG